MIAVTFLETSEKHKYMSLFFHYVLGFSFRSIN